MFLVVGLGNPGKQYERTRHNVGFMVVGAFAIALGLDWKFNKRANADIAKNKDIELVKPQTFMNNSGVSIQSILRSYKLQANSYNLVVVHDDIDLALGTIRMSHNASSGGHNGVQSIIAHLGTKEFWRLRIGIRPRIMNNEELKMKNNIDTPTFVLKPFSKTEQKNLDELIQSSTQLLTETISQTPKVQTIHVLN